MKIFNQNYIETGHSSDCTIYTIAQIIYLQYGIKIKYSWVEKSVSYAVLEWFLLQWWAWYNKIYLWAKNRLTKRTKTMWNLVEVNIASSRFEELLKDWKAFWLGLKYGNPQYLQAIRDNVLTNEEISQINSKKGWFWHNHCYFYRDGKYYIGEVYWEKGSKYGKTVECSLETLRRAVSLGVYYATARTIYLQDNEENRLLIKYNKLYQETTPEEYNKEIEKIRFNKEKVDDLKAMVKVARLNFNWYVDSLV